jgi:hypothetical protein
MRLTVITLLYSCRSMMSDLSASGLGIAREIIERGVVISLERLRRV